MTDPQRCQFNRFVTILLASALILPCYARGQSGSDDGIQLDGAWYSNDDGNVYHIKGATLRQFELTSQTCVNSLLAQRQPGSLSIREARFTSAQGLAVSFRPGSDAQHKLVTFAQNPDPHVVFRLARLPRVCINPTPDTPYGNFEVFAQTFKERYAGFYSHQVNWTAMVASAQANLTADTTSSQLFSVFENLLAPLKDLHTSISASDLKRTSQEFWRAGPAEVMKRGSDALDEAEVQRLFAQVAVSYVRGELHNFCNGQIQYGHLTNNIGYLRILSFDDYSKSGDNLLALEAALDQIIPDIRSGALVVDVRLNIGGDDQLGVALAAHFTGRPYPAYMVKAHVGAQEWSASRTVTVAPARSVRFSGPVVELIGPLVADRGIASKRSSC